MLLMDSMVLAAQQWLNETYTGQHGYTPVTSTANGNFGSSTTIKCPTLSIGDTHTNYVYILQYALYCNGYDPGEFDGVYDSQVQTAIGAFQQFMCLSQTTSTADMTTIKSLLCSSGNTDRAEQSAKH